MNASAYRFAFVALAVASGFAGCAGVDGNVPPSSSRAPLAHAVRHATDPRNLARYSAQLALTILDSEDVDLGFIASLLSPPSGCFEERTFAASGEIVDVTTYAAASQCSGTPEETAAFTIGSTSPFASTFGSSASAGGSSYPATGSLTLTSNSLPFSYQAEAGQPSWQSNQATNAQRGTTTKFSGSGTIGGTLKISGASASFAHATDGTQAVLGTATAKFSSKGNTSTWKESLYESSSQSIAIAPSQSGWTVSGGSLVRGASVAAKLLNTEKGEGGTFAFTYKNPKDPIYTWADGTVTSTESDLYDNGGIATVTLVSKGGTIATLSFDTHGYGTITYFDNSVEYVTDWTIQQGS